MTGNSGKVVESETAEFNVLTIRKDAKVEDANVEGQPFRELNDILVSV